MEHVQKAVRWVPRHTEREHERVHEAAWVRTARLGPALGEQDLRIPDDKSQIAGFTQLWTRAVRPLRAAGAWLDDARGASSNHLHASRKVERGRD